MNEQTPPPLVPVTDAAFGTTPTLRHAFFGRQGGVSRGIHASLNAGLGSTDDPVAVRENRRRIAAHLGIAAPMLHSCRQIHSSDVVTLDSPIETAERPRADALVTNRPALAVCVLTADCAPVLFADPEAGVVGAAHAGWKGALGGVLDNTVAAMVALGAHRNRIRAVIGPCIAQPSYEVGPEFHARFVDHDRGNGRWFIASDKPDHHRFDLPGYCMARMRAAGIAAHWTGDDTCADADRFFSYRRATHNGEPDYGRHLSAIMIA